MGFSQVLDVFRIPAIQSLRFQPMIFVSDNLIPFDTLKLKKC